MAASTYLFDLIRSLSKSEKRYFNLYCAQQSKSPEKYLALFDAIARQEAYDPAKLKKQLSKEVLRNYSYDKNYLAKMILKCMRAYHSGATVDIRLTEMLQDILFLHRKGLYDQSATLIAKAKYLASEYDKFHFTMVFLDLQRKVIKKEWEVEMGKGIRDAIAEKAALFEVLQDHYRLVDIYDQVFVLSRSQSRLGKPESLQALDELISRVGDHPEESPSFLGGLFGLVSLAVYHQLKGEFPQALDYHRRVVRRWESRAEMITEYPHSYRIALSNFLTLCYAAKEWAVFPETLQKLEALPAGSFDEEAEAFQNEYYLRLLYYTNTGQFERADALIPDLKKGMDRYASKINKARELAICYSVALSAFLQGKFSKALDWIRRIRDKESTEHRKDILEFVPILELIVHMELGNSDLVEYQLRSARAFLKKHEALGTFEQEMLSGIRKLIRVDPDTDVREDLAAWQARIEALSPGLGRKISVYWLESMRTGRSMESIFREHLD